MAELMEYTEGSDLKATNRGKVGLMVGLSKAVRSDFLSLSSEMRIFYFSEYLSKDLIQRRRDQKLSLGFPCCFKPEE